MEIKRGKHRNKLYFAVISGPVAEEVLFSGLVYTRLKAGMNKIAAALIFSLLFGIHGFVRIGHTADMPCGVS